MRGPRLALALSLGLAGGVAGAAASEPACQVDVSLDPPRAVVGQQVLYRARITSRDDVASVEWSSPLSFASLRSEALPGDPQPARAEPRAGYRVRDERRALFADAAGRYPLEAPALRCVLRSGALETAPVPVVALEVTPAPAQGQPAGYAGLTGPLGIHVTVTPREVALGESVRVAVMLRGEGNLWAAAPPYDADAFPGSELFERRPQQLLDRGRRLSVRRHFAYEVVPRAEGRLRVPALVLPYFDPGSERYAVARSQAVDVTVRARPPAQEPEALPRARPTTAPPEPDRTRAAWLAAALLAALGIGAVGWLRRGRGAATRSARRALATTAPPATRAAGEPDEATQLDRALRAALARHVADAASVTPQELIARDPADPAVASAAHLLAALERARFDPQAPPPDAAAVRRAIASLHAG